ncbi:glycerophosphocholine phosphodiesterase-like protein Gde1 [Peziza echinospora]|nr:glycerophosphocholine phosphodiesterase-like protein Gde1 [Peziza echinospora]
MKFGRNLARNQVPEWATSYINYKGLKRLLKAEVEKVKNGGDADLTPFFYSLDRNVELVDTFFSKRLAEYTRRFKVLQSKYSHEPHIADPIVDGLGRDELEELVAALLELRSGLRKVAWYGEVNRRGFVKILKKADKKINVCAQKRYLDMKVTPKAFANPAEAESTKAKVNSWLSKLAEADSLLPRDDDDDAKSETSSTTRKLLSRAKISGARNEFQDKNIERVEQSIKDDDGATLEAVLSTASDLLEDSPIKGAHAQKLLLNLLQRAISSKSLRCIDVLLGHIIVLDEDDDIHEQNAIHRLVIAIGRTKSLLGFGSSSQTSLAATIGNVISKQDNVGYGAGSLLQATQSQDFPFFITPAESPISTPPASNNVVELDGSIRLSAHDDSVELLRYLLEKLRPSQRGALVAKDTHGRMPLHYAAQYGFLVICQVVTKYMKEWGQFDVEDGIDALKWQDADGLAPLHLAVMNGHPKTTRYLLQSESWDGTIGALPTSGKVLSARKTVIQSSNVLVMAIKSNATTIVKLLVDAGVNVNYQDDEGEGALHVAAKLGNAECIRILLAGGADVEMTEKAYGWTPVFSAAVEGQLATLEVLVEEGGADISRVDSSGWKAIEHAALRGHLDVAKRLKEIGETVTSTTPVSFASTETAPIAIATSNSLGVISERSSGPSSPGSSIGGTGSYLGGSPPNIPKIISSSADPLKSFGHRYLKRGTTMILVTLGSVDTRKAQPAVRLEKIPLSHAHTTQLDTALSLVVSARNAKGETTIIDLPVHHNLSDDPIVFETSDINNVHLLFDIVPTYSGRPDQKIGRAVALLSTIKQSLGRSRVSLQGGVQVPILSANADADVIGTIDFEFMVITPFEHEGIGIAADKTYWKSMAGPKVIGHRGLGKNQAGRKSLQLGENTLQSFIAAANLGASYVEFDVQLTKDHVPVIYHDFLVGETGIDAPVHTLTLEQFLSMSGQHTPRNSRPGSPDRFGNSPTGNTGAGGGTAPSRSPLPLPRRSRSMSLHPGGKDSPEPSNERMKYTRDYKLKGGFKGNSRGTSIQGPFTTLEEVFKMLPSNIGFNVELKYPMLQESEQEDMDTFGIEMNEWVDCVLKVVYDHGKGRDIIFSSFHPDICLMLSFKQPSIPILFLTEGGTAKMADIRASSLQEAIRFASRWNLLGIVSAAQPLVLCPRLIRIIKESGLVCVTYGMLNNAPENVKVQVDQGIDAVIVDSVLAIRKGLTAVSAIGGDATGNKKDEKPTLAEVTRKVEETKKEIALAVAK